MFQQTYIEKTWDLMDLWGFYTIIGQAKKMEVVPKHDMTKLHQTRVIPKCQVYGMTCQYTSHLLTSDSKPAAIKSILI